jgi:hypothetical protein
MPGPFLHTPPPDDAKGTKIAWAVAWLGADHGLRGDAALGGAAALGTPAAAPVPEARTKNVRKGGEIMPYVYGLIGFAVALVAAVFVLQLL